MQCLHRYTVVVKTELSVKPDLLICVSTLACSHKLRKKIRFKWWKWVLPQREHGKPGHLGGTLSQAGLDGQILILALSAVTDLMAEVVFSESHKHTRSFFSHFQHKDMFTYNEKQVSF